jgi:surface protein
VAIGSGCGSNAQRICADLVVAIPTAPQRANLKLAHDNYRTNTKASFTVAEPLYKAAVVDFGSLFGAGNFLTKSAKKRYNTLLALDSSKPATEQALVGKTPYAASELSTKNMTTTHQGRCASALPTSATYTAQSKRTVNPDMAGSIVLVDCADGLIKRLEGDHVVVFLSCDWNATTTLYEWAAHGTCGCTPTPGCRGACTCDNPQYVFKDSAELKTAVNLWSSNRAAALTTYGHISTNWDTSKVTNMGYLFYSSKTFNDPIGAWDTSSVTSMAFMFYGAAAFNQPLNTWNTSSVTAMYQMFDDATAFNQPLDAWDTHRAYNVSGMFMDATAFNQPLDAWDMFKGAKSSLFAMHNMFKGATSYNQPVGAWSTPKLGYVYGCFAGATAMTYPVPSATLSTADVPVPVGSIIWG